MIRSRRIAIRFQSSFARFSIRWHELGHDREKISPRRRRDPVAPATLLLTELRMTVETQTDPELLLILAKAGYGPALVQLLDRYRLALADLVRGKVGRRLRVKLDVDDV